MVKSSKKVKEEEVDRGMLGVKTMGVCSRRPLHELQMEVTPLPKSQQSISITTSDVTTGWMGEGGQRVLYEMVMGVKSTFPVHLKR